MSFNRWLKIGQKLRNCNIQAVVAGQKDACYFYINEQHKSCSMTLGGLEMVSIYLSKLGYHISPRALSNYMSVTLVVKLNLS